ncbi:16S rRNA (adenine(1518)-N(6)/adenine(1519)-N(6))-dimethyltransferase RsmA [Aegicerativicinus sediminis]
MNNNSKNESNSVRAKKHLGQHFLNDPSVAEKIAETLSYIGYKKVLEIGPGMGVLTQFLLESESTETWVVEIDQESVHYLRMHFPKLHHTIIEGDFLKLRLENFFKNEQFAIIGNFPYNISSQIVFKALEYKEWIPEFSGMFQKEVAERICSKEGSKVYGILSVLTQAFYDAEYLFTVPPNKFSPPPKVDSGVLKLTRKENLELGCDESLFQRVVKTAFQQRRKTLRNSLKTFDLSENLKANVIFGKRPEQLSVSGFVELTEMISRD